MWAKPLEKLSFSLYYYTMEISANGIKINYTDVGSGQPVVLLHGNGESLAIFEKLTEKLSSNYRVIAMDSRGHGASQKGLPLSYSLMAQDVVGLIDALGLKKPYLYGFSDGGIIGLIIAFSHPDLLGKLAISGANLTPLGLKGYFHQLMRLISTLTKGSPSNALYTLMLTEPSITADELRRITVPTLVLAGARDIIRKKETEAIALNVPDSSLLIVPRATHGSYVTDNEKLYGLLAPFFKQPTQ